MNSRSRWMVSSLVVMAGLSMGFSALAQPGTPQPAGLPGTAQPQPPAPPPEPKAEPRPAPKVSSNDPQITAAVAAFCGNYQCPAGSLDANTPALNFNAALVNVEGLDNAIYFEVARADSPFSAVRSGLITFIKPTVNGQHPLVMRVMDFSKTSATFTEMATGFWAVPEQFPALKSSALTINADIPLTLSNGVYSGANPFVPTMADGAVYFSTSINFGNGSISWTDRGIDKDGKQTFGPAAGKTISFAKATPTITVKRQDNGLAVVTMSPPADPKSAAAENGGEMYVQYSGWFSSDGGLFDSSRNPGRTPLRVALPGTLIAGFREGVTGMRKGEVRRLFIPYELGYGEQGSRRIPPKANLVFEIEAVTVTAAKADGADDANKPKNADK